MAQEQSLRGPLLCQAYPFDSRSQGGLEVPRRKDGGEATGRPATASICYGIT